MLSWSIQFDRQNKTHCIPAIHAMGLLVFPAADPALVRWSVVAWKIGVELNFCCRDVAEIDCPWCPRRWRGGIPGDMQRLCHTFGKKDNHTVCLYIHIYIYMHVGLDSRYLVIIVVPISHRGAQKKHGCGNFTLIGCKMSGFSVKGINCKRFRSCQ